MPPFPAISSLVSRHPAILRINLGGARCMEATSKAVAHPPFPSMPTHQSTASAINLVNEESRKGPRPANAARLPGNAMYDVVMHVIVRVEQTLGAWRFSAADQDRHVSGDRLQLAAQYDRWRAAEQARCARADRLRLAARRDRCSAAERETRCATQQEWIH